ncbi:hypothetical protein ACFVIM_02285 [Streptomyces sp. NPDC057638]|uniref:terpene synthase family protein n=1 Tax=Streptomyces sp. NPDC057638 TaxID=3346190 RepID=UPI0036740FB4
MSSHCDDDGALSGADRLLSGEGGSSSGGDRLLSGEGGSSSGGDRLLPGDGGSSPRAGRPGARHGDPLPRADHPPVGEGGRADRPPPHQGPSSLPQPIRCPFPSRISPYARQAATHLDAWVARFGVVRERVARERFERAGFGEFAAVTYPTADLECLCLIADWFGWLFLVDDQLDDGHVGRDLTAARTAAATLLDVLAGPGTPVRPGESGPPLLLALRDLWHRTAPRCGPRWRDRFTRHLTACLDAACWEAANRVAGVVPGEAEYIERRRHTGAVFVCMDLIDVVTGAEIPDHIHAGEEFQTTLCAASDVVAWTNDWYSYGKETALGEYHNLVTVVATARGLTRREAMDHTADAIAAQTRRYRLLRQRLLTVFPGHRAALVRCLAGMESWMRGNLDWSRATLRYAERERGVPAYLEPTLASLDPTPGGQEPTFHGLEPTLHGGEPTFHGLEPTFHGGEPSLGRGSAADRGEPDASGRGGPRDGTRTRVGLPVRRTAPDAARPVSGPHPSSGPACDDAMGRQPNGR